MLYHAAFESCAHAGAIIGDGVWDPRAPMIWDSFFLFLEQIAALIYAHVVGSRMDVVTFRDQVVRVARFSCRFLTAMAGNKAGEKNQSSSMHFNAPNP